MKFSIKYLFSEQEFKNLYDLIFENKNLFNQIDEVILNNDYNYFINWLGFTYGLAYDVYSTMIEDLKHFDHSIYLGSPELNKIKNISLIFSKFESRFFIVKIDFYDFNENTLRMYMKQNETIKFIETKLPKLLAMSKIV